MNISLGCHGSGIRLLDRTPARQLAGLIRQNISRSQRSDVQLLPRNVEQCWPKNLIDETVNIPQVLPWPQSQLAAQTDSLLATTWIPRNQFGAARVVGTGIHRHPVVPPRERGLTCGYRCSMKLSPAKRPRIGVLRSGVRPWLFTPILFQVLGPSALIRSSARDPPGNKTRREKVREAS